MRGGALGDAREDLRVGGPESEGAAGELARSEQCAEQPRIDRERVGMAGVARRRVDPEAVPIVPLRQERRDLRRGENARLGPRTVMDTPEMLRAALGDRKSTRLNSS